MAITPTTYVNLRYVYNVSSLGWPQRMSWAFAFLGV